MDMVLSSGLHSTAGRLYRQTPRIILPVNHKSGQDPSGILASRYRPRSYTSFLSNRPLLSLKRLGCGKRGGKIRSG